MGASQSDSLIQNTINLSDYDIIERCSEGLLLRHSLINKLYILKDQIIADKNRHDAMLKYLIRQRNTRFTHLLNVIGFEKHIFRNICSSIYKISTVLQFSTVTLLAEIKLRQHKNKRFTESDLLRIMAWIVEAAKELLQYIEQADRELQYIPSFNIMPSKIFIMEDNTLKLSSRLLQDPDQPEIEQYFSPERFEGSYWNRAQSATCLELERELVFCIGLTVLSAALLQDCLDCYDFKENCMRTSLIEDKVDRCQQVYSSHFTALISQTLDFNPFQRQSMRQLGDHIQTYRNEQPQRTLTKLPTISDLSSIGEKVTRNHSQTSIDDVHQMVTLVSQVSSVCSINKKQLLGGSTVTTCKSESNCLKTNDGINQQTVLSDGSIYNGEIKQGRMDGFGKLTLAKGSYYCGNFSKDTYSDQGRFFYGNNKLAYDGIWKDDLFHGSGTHFNEKPIQQNTSFDCQNFNFLANRSLYYRDSFVNNAKEGEGTLVLTNGEYFRGQFRNDWLEGKGEFHHQNGTVIKGKWLANQLTQK